MFTRRVLLTGLALSAGLFAAVQAAPLAAFDKASFDAALAAKKAGVRFHPRRLVPDLQGAEADPVGTDAQPGVPGLHDVHRRFRCRSGTAQALQRHQAEHDDRLQGENRGRAFNR